VSDLSLEPDVVFSSLPTVFLSYIVLDASLRVCGLAIYIELHFKNVINAAYPVWSSVRRNLLGICLKISESMKKNLGSITKTHNFEEQNWSSTSHTNLC